MYYEKEELLKTLISNEAFFKDLREVSIEGPSFHWWPIYLEWSLDDQIASRLHHFLVSKEWENLLKEANITEGVANAFHNILSKLRKWRPSIKGLAFESLDIIDLGLLKEKVYAALPCLCEDKAPALDGLSMAF